MTDRPASGEPHAFCQDCGYAHAVNDPDCIRVSGEPHHPWDVHDDFCHCHISICADCGCTNEWENGHPARATPPAPEPHEDSGQAEIAASVLGSEWHDHHGDRGASRRGAPTMSPRPMRRYRADAIDREQQTLRVSQRLTELHERGPIGRLEAHRLMRDAGIIRCPVCEPEGAA